jgi:hypothetical protein
MWTFDTTSELLSSSGPNNNTLKLGGGTENLTTDAVVKAMVAYFDVGSKYPGTLLISSSFTGTVEIFSGTYLPEADFSSMTKALEVVKFETGSTLVSIVTPKLFEFCSNLHTVVFPPSLLAIGTGALFGAPEIKNLTMNEILWDNHVQANITGSGQLVIFSADPTVVYMVTRTSGSASLETVKQEDVVALPAWATVSIIVGFIALIVGLIFLRYWIYKKLFLDPVLALAKK